MIEYVHWKGSGGWTQIHARMDESKTTLCGLKIPQDDYKIYTSDGPASCYRCYLSPKLHETKQ